MKIYRLLTGGDDSAFCHKVSLAIAKGWKLYGSPTVTFDSATGKTVCAQAVVKKVKGKDYSPDMKLGEQ